MDNLDLSVATYDDVDHVCSIARKSGVTRYPKFIYQLFIALSFLFLIRRNGRPIGYIAFLVIPWSGSVFLAQIAVRKQFQHMGVGSLALEWTILRLQEQYKITSALAHTIKKQILPWLKKKKFKVVLSFFNQVWFVYRRL